MDMQNFSVTLSVFGLESEDTQRPVKCDLSVRLNLVSETVVTIYTASSLYTGDLLLSISFVGNGPLELPTPDRLRLVVPGPLVDMYRSILPRLEEFAQVMGGAPPSKQSKG